MKRRNKLNAEEPEEEQMWHRFGQGLREIILNAAARAEAEQQHDLSTRHLLWALAAEAALPATRILARLGITPGMVHQALERAAPGERLAGGSVPALTAEARNAVDAAYCIAGELRDEYVGSEHLLLAFLRASKESDAGRILAQLGAAWQPAGQALMTQQKWRIDAPKGVAVPNLHARRLQQRLRGKAGRIKLLAYGLSHPKMPFMPYLIFRKRTTDNPYPFYTRLRCQPVYWDPLIQHWIVTQYEDVVAALAETRLSQRIFSPLAWSHEGLPPLVAREFRQLQTSLDRQMLFQDAPDQPKQKALVSKRFTPRVIAQMQDQIRQTADMLLDSVQAAGQMDVLADLAVPFPLLAISRMLGLPPDDLPQLKKWSKDYFRYLTFETSLADDLAAYHAVQEAEAYFRALLPARRRQLQVALRSADTVPDDLITLLLQADEEGEFLPEDEVVANCLLLLATGHENITRVIGSGLLALLRHPQQWRSLCEDPALAGGAVEEMLRFEGSVQWTLRTLQEDYHWHGCALKRGQRVQIGIGPANHDPAQFPEADRFDITRSPNRHVAFGQGAHFCLGAALTRLELRIIFSGLSARFPHLSLLSPPVWRQEGIAFRSLEALHVRWDPEHGCKQPESKNAQQVSLT